MLKKILLVVVVLLAGLAAVIAFQPSEYKVTRSATIGAPPAAVFALINDFHQWDRWSPWAKRDPAMKVTYEGPSAGAGAVYKWVGNSDVGEGKMTISDSREPDVVHINLEFIKPFAGLSPTEFKLEPSGQGTVVHWTMSGELNFFTKGFGLFTGGMDKMIGPDFDKGLERMKSAAEGH